MQHKRIIIIPYNVYSNSAKQLQKSLKKSTTIPSFIINKDSKTYQPRWNDYVINWGCSKEWDWINKVEKCPWQSATNKLNFFEKIKDFNLLYPNNIINIPEWTTELKTALEWIDKGKTVLARTILNGHSGNGIILMEPTADKNNVQAPLYVQYKKKTHEYRCHFFKEKNNTYKIIDITQKKKRKDFENVNTKIRNHQNGWIYARENITEPTDLRHQALNAALVSGLPFGAVDLIWNALENKCYVLEVNTAPGITGTTLEKYVKSFVQDINNEI